jgi:acetolactate synthase I/II/III large subunit
MATSSLSQRINKYSAWNLTMKAIRSGAQILVDQLKIHAVNHVFCVPGESYLSVLDALHDAQDIKVVSCRHEGGAAMMADAYGKLQGTPGICMVTRGPGATNASAGLHVAMQDATPMILFIGQVARPMMEREAFQELDYRRVFGELAKWVAQIDDASRIPEMVSRAFHTATSGRPGPVVLALPEDMLADLAEVQDARPHRVVETSPGPDAMEELAGALNGAERPLVLLGGGGWSHDAVTHMEAFAQRLGIPVAAAFRRQDRFNNQHPSYVGHVGIGVDRKLAARVRSADLLLVIGARLGEMTTGGYTLIDIPVPAQTLIHVHPDPTELGRVYQPTLAITAGAGPFAAALARLDVQAKSCWTEWTASARSEYQATLEVPRSPGNLQMGSIMRWLNESLPVDSIVSNGAGNFTTWVHRFFQYKQFGTQLAPTSGSMGYGVPAAVAAKIVNPSRTVLCVAGDGDFMMTAQELATAVQYDAPIILLIVNNGMYGTIRMHQERHFPGRVIGTDLWNPDFVALARAYGAHAELVDETEQFIPAFERARTSGRLAVLELRIDPQALTISQSLDAVREAALAAATS